MAITAIKNVRNDSGVLARIRNIETPTDTGPTVAGGTPKGDVSPNTVKDLEMWIPWARSQQEFNGHHIRIDLDPPTGPMIALWQHDDGSLDRVRFSVATAPGTVPTWSNSATEVPGVSTVGGDRTLVINAGATGISLEVFAPSVPAPGLCPSFGKTPVGFFDIDDPKRKINYNGSTLPPFLPAGCPVPVGDLRIDRIRNTAQDVNGQVGIPLKLSFVDSDGRPAGPVDLEPDQTVTGDFQGLRLTGSWEAHPGTVQHPISVVFVKDSGFSIDLFWTALGTSGGALTGGPQVEISDIKYNPPGSDLKPEAGEYVELINTGVGTADVGGWYILDRGGPTGARRHKITIPAGYFITPGATLRIYTGAGTNTADRYYDGRGTAVWNNPGDAAFLYASDGTPVHALAYQGT